MPENGRWDLTWRLKCLIISTFPHSITVVCHHRCSQRMLCDLHNSTVSNFVWSGNLKKQSP